MKKPTNRFSILMWVLAAVIVAGEARWFIQLQWASPFNTLWALIERDVAQVGALIAFGVIIELVDQIRWNALPPEQRNRR